MLHAIVHKQVTTIPYQNTSLHHGCKVKYDLSITSLLENLIMQSQGGMCYELSELMFHVSRIPHLIL
ncbi:MAG: arylamine N-acetyltransferase [Legionella sp.]